MGRLSFTGGVAFPLHHGGYKRKCPLSRELFSWDVRGTSSTKSTVTECVKKVMVVYSRSFDFFYVENFCFTSTVSSWCHVGTVHTVPMQVFRQQFTSI